MNIDTVKELVDYVESEFKMIERELNNMHAIKDDIDLHGMCKNMLVVIADQALKAGLSIDGVIPRNYRTYKTPLYGYTIVREELDAGSQMRADILKQKNKFKHKYMTWAKNLISDLNRTKMLNKWQWLDVMDLAKILTELEINKDESYIPMEAFDTDRSVFVQ